MKSVNPIKSARDKAGLSQTEVAKEMNVSCASVCRWESGIAFPSTKRLGRLAKVLNTTVEKLIEGKEAG